MSLCASFSNVCAFLYLSLLATVVGGENVARGALLGALLGAAHGTDAFSGWPIQGLRAAKEISAEAEHLIGMV